MRAHRVILGLLCMACVPASADQPFREEPVAGPQAPQAATTTLPDPAVDVVYVCPMDPDVRSHQPGTCRRCGMTLVAGVPEPVEFHVDVNLIPPAPVPRQPAVL